jgi:YbbR domain-containing protein
VRSRSFGGSLASDWRLKLAAFFLAVFLWALVKVGSPDQRAVSIPVTVSLNDPEWILMGDPVPSTVEVRFSGPSTEVFRLTALDGVSVTVPVTEVAGEDMVIALQDSWIPVDGYRGVIVEDILPSTVHVHLDQRETASVPVRITTRGSLPEHLALTRSLSVTPSAIRVSGPASLVQLLDSLDIVPVDLGEVDERGAVQTTVDTTGLARITVIPSEITLRIPVEESIDRVLASVPVSADGGAELEEAGGTLEVLPATVRLTLRGARTQVTNLDPRRLQVVVPPAELLGLRVAEERRVPIVVEGLPSYMSASPAVDTVVVRRPTEP